MVGFSGEGELSVRTFSYAGRYIGVVTFSLPHSLSSMSSTQTACSRLCSSQTPIVKHCSPWRSFLQWRV